MVETSPFMSVKEDRATKVQSEIMSDILERRHDVVSSVSKVFKEVSEVGRQFSSEVY